MSKAVTEEMLYGDLFRTGLCDRLVCRLFRNSGTASLKLPMYIIASDPR
jgi:hypothetical protein